ncbi:hypothetical protein HU200_059641 [Digitaria exilis]|uniref:GATA-type domain-containing protein n=1 Tax=Digitaria exilis TaxID=1010633 RepID=A0A835ABV1_9POAL|nr:hypothetical protein HU200_059641 [Digitaria exilis]
MTRKGCVLPSSAHRRSSPVTTTAGIMVSGKPRRAQQQQPATSPEVTPDDCSPILAWSPGSSSDPDVYLVKRKCPKSSSAPPPPAPATEPSPEAAHEQPVVQNVVRRPRQRRAVGKRCRHCTSSETSQWRPGPDGPSTLCNACGTRYRQGRLLPEYRPKASPGFRPSVHANQHKKVLQLHRRRRRRGAPPPPDPADGGGDSTDEDDVLPAGSGGDHLRYELSLPWRWQKSNKGFGMGEESSAE